MSPTALPFPLAARAVARCVLGPRVKAAGTSRRYEGQDMTYSTANLHDPGIVPPLRCPIKVIIEYRPGGAVWDYALVT